MVGSCIARIGLLLSCVQALVSRKSVGHDAVV